MDSHYAIISRLLVLILAIAVRQTAAVNAKASHYEGNLSGGNCMLTSYTIPAGIFGTAISNSNYDSSSMCGVCLTVKGPNGSMKAMVVDSCPDCTPNKLDLFSDGFRSIGDLNAGIIDVDWEVTSCGITEPLKVRNKDGTSKHWFSMQVYDSNQQVKSLDVSTDGGATWQQTTRRPYNFFEKTSGGGFGADSITVRVTCAGGGQVTIENVGVAGGSGFTASGNC
ncbi:hypothetical protein PpBr36_02463 [Pyricularia pennisetigena]|uniref:hypothetical protein n=1 Tax=Pyricularia pennisetigena TaxID=1578925 RepID=UPI00114F75F9|nr:hypothetical protein PpBr36_02463 [Pyricularia pennisetigena]TLS30453.1 hypothetical protein PpBr36_02463 [Pyricularia pennisetigena]